MKARIFPFLIGLAALAVSGSAAFYSVFGLSKLFAGASTQVIIMAGSLEFAKLVVASLLYQYWGTINKWLRAYLSIAVFVLIIITSGGIYGFLSGAYQETATKSEFLDKSLAVLEIKQERFAENKTDLKLEKKQLNKTISDLRKSLSNPTSVSYYSEDAGQVITTSSSSARRALQLELKTTITDRDNINLKLETVQDSIMSLDSRILDLAISNEDERELGPLKYLAETTGKDMGQVVNWFLLLIIFVFDPLAIAMVIAANFAFAQIKPEEKEIPSPHYSPQPSIPREVIMKELDTEEFDDIPEEIKDQEDQLMLKEELYTEEDEKRMDVIGQNGNDGIHYDEKEKVEISLEKENKDIIVDKGEDNPPKKIVSAKDMVKMKQQNKLTQERLVYRNNR
tara:strand:+ start:1369 stop:2556 length:1188 start_codon:yes stop_codon:yes gene_type:complete